MKTFIKSMREATKEEIEGVDNYIKSISKDTGKNFNDYIPESDLEENYIQDVLNGKYIDI